MIGGQHVESNQVTSKQNHGKVDRWVVIQYFFPPLPPRYDSEGNFLDSLPDLLEARWKHACTTLEFPNGTEVLKKI